MSLDRFQPAVRGRRRVSALALMVSMTVIGVALPRAHAEPTAAERSQAADAYDRGATAYRARDFAAAAQWFERANHLLPSTVALVSAMRSHRSARNTQRAGTIALRLEGEPGLSGPTAVVVRQALAAARPRFVRIEVACNAACSLAVAGTPEEFTRFFAPANVDIEVVATFATGAQTQHVTGRPGTVHTLAFDAPGAAPETAVAADEPALDDELGLDDGENPYRISRRRFLSRPRATFFMSLTAAVAVSGITVWSAVDARASGQDLDAAEAGTSGGDVTLLAAEHARDVKRTHGYIGFSVVMLAVTGLVAGFTDWTPHGDAAAPSTEASVDVSATGAELHVLRRF